MLLAVVATACGNTAVTVRPAARVAPRPVHAAASSPRPALPPGCSRRAEACVSAAQRLAWLQRDGRIVLGPVHVALGGVSHRTPLGTFHVSWKDAEHTSSTYGTDMPYAVFFAAGGIAFHQGPLGEPSHGCVHLPPGAARAFFEALQPGDRVEVF